MEKLSQDRLEQIEHDYGMTPEGVKEDLANIREWVRRQPHLPSLPDDKETEEWLHGILFNSKNSVERTKQHLDVYFSAKSSIPELFNNLEPKHPDIEESVKNLYYATLPKLTPKGYRVRIYGHRCPDPSLFDANASMRRSLMISEMMMKEDFTAGDIMILDLKNSSLAFWTRYNLVIFSKFLTAVMKGFPRRIKAMHFINAPGALAHAIGMVTSFFSEKVKKRVRISPVGNSSHLLEDVPKECLPLEMGGTLDVTLQQLSDLWHQKMLAHRDWFLAHGKLKSDETKRPADMKQNDEFGCDGSFRRLCVD